MAAATERTLLEACSEADTTVLESSCVLSAVVVSVLAVAVSSPEAEETALTMLPTTASNSAASFAISDWRSAAASAFFFSFSCAWTRTKFSRKPSVARAMTPISSLRSTCGMTTA